MSKKLSQQCLDVLSACEIVGNVLYIRSGNLDRKLYVEVNAALESIGGKWDKKLKGHVFPNAQDASDAFDIMLETGEATRPVNYQQLWQFFPTPDEVVQRMLDEIGWFGTEKTKATRILEPSCGDGAILKHLITTGGYILGIEKQPELEVKAHKFMEEHCPGNAWDIRNQDFFDFVGEVGYEFDFIVMNPPFNKGQDAQHIRHAHSLLKEGGRLVAIAGAGVTFRNDGHYKGFREWVAENGGRIEKLSEGSFKGSGTMVNSVMVIF